MAIFGKKSEGEKVEKEEKTKKATPIKPARIATRSVAGGSEKKTKSVIRKGDTGLAYKFLVEPWITEKSHDAMAGNKYIFRVAKDSNKREIKETTENLYNVTVTAVRTINIHRKKRVYGRTSGWKAGYKKAIVTLKEGDKIELFKGV
jgi:large subunit ribosomal protein L23